MTRALPVPVLPALLTVALALAMSGCTKVGLIDFAMSSARRPPKTTPRVGPYELLAGDLHCHVLPPDAPYHVDRALPETLDLARKEGLDFVVLTPHVNARFFLDEDRREWVLRTQRELKARVAASATPDLVVIPGMEYTDHRHGHVGMGFADAERVLSLVTTEAARMRPSLFFEVWQAEGGLTTINHPFLGPLPKAPIAELRYDLSWRAFHEPVHPGMTEIHWLTAHADAIETWNESVGHMRDRVFMNDASWEMRQASHLLERLAREQQRPIAAAGGSDSHSHWLRPTTWVLAREKSSAGIREAVVNARTCARSPEPCTLEARGDGDWVNVGGHITSKMHRIEARAASDARYFLNGELVVEADAAASNPVTIPTTGRCSTLRVEISEGASSPIYVDCPGITGPPLASAR